MKQILVTNDDGVRSTACTSWRAPWPGSARSPSSRRIIEASAIGHALTLRRPLRVEQLDDRVYEVDGTPTDCVNVAITQILAGAARPDPVGHQQGLQPRRRRDVFGHRGGRDGRGAARHPAIAVSLERSVEAFRSGSEIESTGDLENEILGVQLGTMGQAEAGDLLNTGAVKEPVRTYRTIDQAFVALEQEEVDGVIYDLPAAQTEVDESDGELELVEVIPTGSQYGIAFPKESPLVEPVNQALAEIKEDGTYEEIYEKWIGRPPEEIP